MTWITYATWGFTAAGLVGGATLMGWALNPPTPPREQRPTWAVDR